MSTVDPCSVESTKVRPIPNRTTDVLPAPLIDVLTTGSTLLDRGRRSNSDRSSGDLGVIKHHSVRRNDRTGANNTAVKHHGPVTDENVILDRAPLEVDQVTEHTIITHHRRPLRRGVQHSVVLNARAFADEDLAPVPPEDRAWPHRRQCSERHRPDNRGLRVNKSLTAD